MIRYYKKYYRFEESDKNYFLSELKNRNISLRQFAELIGYSPAYVSMIVRGERSMDQDLYYWFDLKHIDKAIEELDNIF